MPTYDYHCDNCKHKLEVIQRFSEEPLVVCPQCSKPALKRLLGYGGGIIFNGRGFYQTDYGGGNASFSAISPPVKKS